MASHLDLEEQEQLAQLRHFWNTYGQWITWLLIAVLGAYVAWNGYQYWQRDQAAKASVMFDEVERAVAAGDAARIERSLADMKDKYGSTTYAHQAALLAARALAEQDKTDAARAALQWVQDKAGEPVYRDVARLRLAGLQLDAQAYDQALAFLQGTFDPALEALAADLRGDVLMAKGQPAEAVSAYRQAWQRMDAKIEYRRLVQAKLLALGVDPEQAETSR
jgi:predicted negative regulator of RcsB-dependent stress response